jgi:hypothetical protein
MLLSHTGIKKQAIADNIKRKLSLNNTMRLMGGWVRCESEIIMIYAQVPAVYIT